MMRGRTSWWPWWSGDECKGTNTSRFSSQKIARTRLCFLHMLICSAPASCSWWCEAVCSPSCHPVQLGITPEGPLLALVAIKEACPINPPGTVGCRVAQVVATFDGDEVAQVILTDGAVGFCLESCQGFCSQHGDWGGLSSGKWGYGGTL